MPTDREWASLLWLAIVLALFFWKAAGREHTSALLGLLLSPVLLIPLVLYSSWMVGVVWCAAQVGAWDTPMVKDTLFWTAPAAALFVGSGKVGSEPGFFRNRLRQAVGFAVFVGFYLNLGTLDVWWEFLLQFVIFVAVAVLTLADHRVEMRGWRRPAAAVLGVVGIGLLVPPTVHLVANWATIDWAVTLRQFLFPVWLTLGALPFIYGLGLYGSYGTAFLRLGSPGTGRRVRWRARLAFIVSFHLRAWAMTAFGVRWSGVLADVSSFGEARQIIAARQAELRAEEATKKKAADDLVRFAGVEGTDGAGRRLDRREFGETADALEWLHSMEQGAYRNRGRRYRGDLLDEFTDPFNRCGLPEAHGIVLQVSRSAQSWFAWRRTPSGWCFAIGAAGPPPDEWYFDGPEPPTCYPRSGLSWVEQPFAFGTNWPE